MQFHLQVFKTEDHHDFRIIDRGGEPWFVLADVCRALEIADTGTAARRLDDDEKGVHSMHTPGGLQDVTIINESGLYSLILTSRKSAAKRFKKWVTSEVLPAIRKTGTYSLGRGAPAFIKRFNENWDRVDAGHFSILNETVARIYGRFEMAGHVIADKAPDGKENRMDGAVGRRFSDWLKANYPGQKDNFSHYMHKTPQWEGLVRQYPNSMLPLFIEFVEGVWMPKYAQAYISPRDPAALPFLDKIIPALDKPRAGMIRSPSFQPPARRG